MTHLKPLLVQHCGQYGGTIGGPTLTSCKKCKYYGGISNSKEMICCNYDEYVENNPYLD